MVLGSSNTRICQCVMMLIVVIVTLHCKFSSSNFYVGLSIGHIFPNPKFHGLAQFNKNTKKEV